MRSLSAAFSLVLAGLLTAADSVPPVAAFSLPGVDGPTWTLPASAKAVAVVFLGNSCPINTAYRPKLAELHAEFSKQGVAFVGVHSHYHEGAEVVKAAQEKLPLPFPELLDPHQKVATLLGAERVPEVVLLNAERRVVYRGRIDDQFGFDTRRPKPTRRDLAEALAELLEGKPVSVPATAVEGCFIARAPTPKTGATVTYHKDVAKVLQARCQECHRAGEVGPFPLMTYADASANAAMIREVVDNRRMPPWHASPKHGRFENSRALSDTERGSLLAWVDAGCPEGDRKDAPKPRQFVTGWNIGKPDAVFTMPSSYDVPAQMPKNGVAYKYFIVRTNFDEDRWVQAAEARPGAREIVHHILIYIQKPGERRDAAAEDRIGAGLLTSYAPGDDPSVYPPGYAKKLPKGASVVFQMHYTPDGTARADQSSVGMVFSKEPPKHEVRTRSVATTRFQIPAGDGNYEVQSRATFREDSEIIQLMPHMHLRGKDFQYEAVYPDGKRERLLTVPKYDFNWQTSYRLAERKRIPAGTRIECVAHFDNSTANKNNPDPAVAVRWGDQTWQEMMIGFVDYAVVGGKE